jgi:cytochrome P450
MLIPKNTLMFIPTWSLHHSEELFGEDHDVYNPDRYLGYDRLANDYAGSPDYERRDHYNYGAGRRICPGIHLAERNMWRIAAKLLWAFEFSEPIDPHTGKVVPIDPDAYSNGILVMAHRYKVTIKPRSEEHVKTIRADRDRALEFLKQFDDDSKPLDA